MTSSATGPVLVVGGTGHLGSQVAGRLLARGHTVHALVRPGSNAAALQDQGVTVVRGDLLDRASLDRAVAPVRAVVTCAAGYTRRRKGDSAQTDEVGNRNLVDAARDAHTARFVFTSILACHLTPQVEHFWHKKLIEDYLDEQQVPFVALRPGVFLDQPVDAFAAQLRRGMLVSLGSSKAAWSYVYTADLADHLAAAVDAPITPGERVDIGMDRPLSARDLAALAADALGRRTRVLTMPWPVIGPVLGLAGRYNPALREVRPMFDFLLSGRSVADTRRQRELFGPEPGAADTVTRWLNATASAAR